ncbi:NAD(P)-binding protein [Basidiobolus meristosporus CBS 931.73]|uniref:Short-chain dehydrogenase/reductase 3 n=1 Tax=Basidiobolus meristosporus CBS 931.73 TaxID=1314790 RepID=A0A1Y1YTQ5_9FUNG|nr:NAD(P)-binding protein [Basidiobolus meristosporus CBS 931.73]|eukprot:ORY01391.1 NAD(P)-binding protein [Basidiobolus meristosporus CBS 931.73]
MAEFNFDFLLRILRVSVFYYGFGACLLWYLFSTGVPCSGWGAIWYAYGMAVICSALGYRLLHPPSKNKLDWNDEIVLITGGASGIGFMLAETLAVRNIKTIVLDVNEVKSEHSMHFYRCDVAVSDQVSAVAEKIRKEVGNPTILINNAGIVIPNTILDARIEDIERTLNVNLASQFWTIKEFLPSMIKNNHGHIVSISSALGLVGAAQAADYSASKAGIIALHDSLREELASRYPNVDNVHCSILIPGLINTGMFAGVTHPLKFLLSTLEPSEVVQEIEAILESNVGNELKIPFYVNFTPLLRMAPNLVKNLAHKITGSNVALKKWRGKSKAQ